MHICVHVQVYVLFVSKRMSGREPLRQLGQYLEMSTYRGMCDKVVVYCPLLVWKP